MLKNNNFGEQLKKTTLEAAFGNNFRGQL